MTREFQPGLGERRLSRRNMLAAMGLAGAAAVSLPVLSACGVGGRISAPNGASDVSGGFDWRKAAGSTINILQTPHPYQQSYQPLLKEFTELTGITVNVDLVPEADYFTKLNTEFRLLAVIRLGITDNAQIAQFLHISINTVYTYRNRLRNAATIPPQEFEKRILEIR